MPPRGKKGRIGLALDDDTIMEPLRAAVAASAQPTSTIMKQIQGFNLQTAAPDGGTRWQDMFVAVRFRESDMVLHFEFGRDDAAILGPSSFYVETTLRDASRQDPKTAYSQGLRLFFELRVESGSAYLSGNVHLLSAKPSHGVMRGTDALQTAVALARWFGARGLELQDMSRRACPSGKGTLLLRRTRILSKGQGWYESQGFRSVVEILEPGVFQKQVPLLHRMSVETLRQALQAAFDALQDAIVHHRTHQSFGRLTILEYERHVESPTVHGPPKAASKAVTMDTLVSAMRQVSTPATALRTRSGPLGEVIDRLIEEDCATASEVVEGLLPDTTEFRVVSRDVAGRDIVPPLPQLAAWVYTWRVVNGFPDMYMDLQHQHQRAF
jgi:hypothetical protein